MGAGVAQITVQQQRSLVGTGKTGGKLGGGCRLSLPFNATGDEDHLGRLAAGLEDERPDGIAAFRQHGTVVLPLPKPRCQWKVAEHPRADPA